MDERGEFFSPRPVEGAAYGIDLTQRPFDKGKDFAANPTLAEIISADETSRQEPAIYGVNVATHGEGGFSVWGGKPTPQSGLDDGTDPPFDAKAALQNTWPETNTQDVDAWGADAGAGNWLQAEAWGAESAPRSDFATPTEQNLDTEYGFRTQLYPVRESSFVSPELRTNYEVGMEETRLLEGDPTFAGIASSRGGGQTRNGGQRPAAPEESKTESSARLAQETSDDEMSTEEAAAIFAANSSGWGRKTFCGQHSAPAPAEEVVEAPVQKALPASSVELETEVPARLAQETSDDEMSTEEAAAIFAANSGGWKRKTTRNSSHDEPAASAAQPASEPPAPPAEEKKSAQPAEAPPMKQQMDNEQPAEKIRPEPEEEPQPPVETAAEEEENPLQHRSVFGRAGSASARAASGGWSAFRKMASEEKSGNPFETGAGGHSFAAAARKAQEQHAAHTFGRHSAGESHTGGSGWQGWGKHQTTEESAPRTSAGVFGRRSRFGAAASRPREEEIRCPSCGAKNPAGAKFCCMCRAELRLAENVCPNCGGKVEPGMKFCPFCGKDI